MCFARSSLPHKQRKQQNIEVSSIFYQVYSHTAATDAHTVRIMSSFCVTLTTDQLSLCCSIRFHKGQFDKTVPQIWPTAAVDLSNRLQMRLDVHSFSWLYRSTEYFNIVLVCDNWWKMAKAWTYRLVCLVHRCWDTVLFLPTPPSPPTLPQGDD